MSAERLSKNGTDLVFSACMEWRTVGNVFCVNDTPAMLYRTSSRGNREPVPSRRKRPSAALGRSEEGSLYGNASNHLVSPRLLLPPHIQNSRQACETVDATVQLPDGRIESHTRHWGTVVGSGGRPSRKVAPIPAPGSGVLDHPVLVLHRP
jgi:hypothetical protein